LHSWSGKRQETPQGKKVKAPAALGERGKFKGVEFLFAGGWGSIGAFAWQGTGKFQ